MKLGVKIERRRRNCPEPGECWGSACGCIWLCIIEWKFTFVSCNNLLSCDTCYLLLDTSSSRHIRIIFSLAWAIVPVKYDSFLFYCLFFKMHTTLLLLIEVQYLVSLCIAITCGIVLKKFPACWFNSTRTSCVNFPRKI
jgi:hypothetical protein